MNVVTQLTQFVGDDVINKNTTDLAVRCSTGLVEFSCVQLSCVAIKRALTRDLFARAKFLFHFGDRGTYKETYKQLQRLVALSRFRCRLRRLNKLISCKRSRVSSGRKVATVKFSEDKVFFHGSCDIVQWNQLITFTVILLTDRQQRSHKLLPRVTSQEKNRTNVL